MLHKQSFPQVVKMLGLRSLSLCSIDLDLRNDFQLPSLRKLSLMGSVRTLPTCRYLFSVRALPNLEALAAECCSHQHHSIVFPECVDLGLLQQLKALQFLTIACPNVANIPHLPRLFELAREVTDEDEDRPFYLRPNDCILLDLFSEDGWGSKRAEEEVSTTVKAMTGIIERCGPFRAIFLPLFLHPNFTVGRDHHDASTKLLKLMEDRNVEVVWRMKPHIWGNADTVSEDFLDYLKRRGLWRTQQQEKVQAVEAR